MRQLLTKTSILGVVLCVVLSALRYVSFDNVFLLGLVPVAPWFLLISALVLGATLSPRVLLATAIGSLVVVGLAMPGAAFPRTGCVIERENTAAPTDENTIVVYSQNVLFGAADPEEVVAQVVAVDADVVVFQEAVTGFVDRISPRLVDHPHVVTVGNQTVASRWPINTAERLLFETDTHGLLDTTIDAPRGEVRLINVHATPPQVPAGRELQKRQFDFLAQVVVDAGEMPVIAMGDFNATRADRSFRALFNSNGGNSDAVDAHRTAGCGFGVTWTPFPGLGPSWIGIDHAVISGADVETFVVLDYAGSDHKATAVEVALPG